MRKPNKHEIIKKSAHSEKTETVIYHQEYGDGIREICYHKSGKLQYVAYYKKSGLHPQFHKNTGWAWVHFLYTDDMIGSVHTAIYEKMQYGDPHCLTGPALVHKEFYGYVNYSYYIDGNIMTYDEFCVSEKRIEHIILIELAKN